MEIFYLHLLTPVTTNKRVFQCLSNFYPLAVATLIGKSCQMSYLKKGCMMLRLILILHAYEKISSNAGDSEDYCVVVCDAV